MATAADKPLVTFAIASLNQEQFIREAVEAAFAQTYSPLEIILSDDHSEDATFTIMQELANSYRGPHRIILNQNPTRRCIGGHLNRIVEISSGDLIVGAAGDDVSLPDRTQQACDLWEKSGRLATSIHFAFIQIDENGNKIPARYKSTAVAEGQGVVEQPGDALAYVKTLEPCIFGCAHAFSRKLFQLFGNLPENIIHEDNALGLRSVLGGKIIYSPAPMVKYRVHGNNVHTTRDHRIFDLAALEREEHRLRRSFLNREIMYAGFLPDLEKAAQLGLIQEPQKSIIATEALNRQRRFALLAEFLESTFLRKCKIVRQLRRLGMKRPELGPVLKRFMPRSLFVRARLALSYASLLRPFGRVPTPLTPNPGCPH
jgi:glycosyltransferase involved in cell wall biosynthesis